MFQGIINPSMEKLKNFRQTIIVFMLFFWPIFALISLFFLPITVMTASEECAHKYYEDAPVKLALNQWVAGNAYSTIIYPILLCLQCCRQSSKNCGCALYTLPTELYSLFEITWNLIGFILINYNKQSCESSQDDQSTKSMFFPAFYFTLYYSLLGFFLVTILLILQSFLQKYVRSYYISVRNQSAENIRQILNENIYGQQPSTVLNRLSQRIFTRFDD